MLKRVVDFTYEYIKRMPKDERKRYGQFFTGEETARFMAGLFSFERVQENISVLDPGAGSGILSCALLERLDEIDSIRSVDVTCYENDERVLGLLRDNLEYCRLSMKKKLTYHVLDGNYITDQCLDFNHMLGENPDPHKYDFVICNPPYMKIQGNAPEAASMRDICHGAPNLYFLFAAMGLFDLKSDGEMVYIIPRSWTSGAYFKRFRKYLLTEGKLTHIHSFVSRDKVFDGQDVLQETMIVKVKKTKETPQRITITSSVSGFDFKNLTSLDAPYGSIVSGDDFYVHLPTDEDEMHALEKVRGFGRTLPEIGLKMKTGLIVDFRNRDMLRDREEEGAIPLFYAQHIKQGRVVFPIKKCLEYAVVDQTGLKQKNRNYLFVKRFTTKEERRRLQCGVYLARDLPQYETISTQNKINFIDGTFTEMSECLVYGLYVLFNSTLYDIYYRILNGSTQVNSTEINDMPVPELEVIRDMGRELMKTGDMSEKNCDAIMEEYCG